MVGPVEGELHSPGVGAVECSGTGRCENLIRAALGGLTSVGSVGARRGPIETLRRRRFWRVIAGGCEACERRWGSDPSSRPSLRCPREVNPKGGAGWRRSKPPMRFPALPRGKDPETGARCSEPSLRWRKQRRAKRYVGSSQPKRCETFREVKPPKGESHECRRCETKPARDSRE
jgi:hypothetical protein